MSIAVDVIFEDVSSHPRAPRRVRCNQGVVFENTEPGCPVDVATNATVAHHLMNGENERGWRISSDPVGTRLWKRMFVMAVPISEPAPASIAEVLHPDGSPRLPWQEAQ